MARYQIIKIEPGADRWSFVAHGARWSKDEAADMIERMQARGCAAKLLEIPAVKGAK